MSVTSERTIGAGVASARSFAAGPPRAPLAHRIALLCMLVYISKIGNIFPEIGAIQLGKVLIGAALIALVFERGGWWEGMFQRPEVRALFAMVGVAFITAPFGVWPGNSAAYITNALIKDIIFFFLLIVTMPSYADVRRAIWMFAISTLIMDVLLLKYGLGQTGIGQFTLGKNETAMTSVLAAALLIPLDARGLGKPIKLTAIILLIVAILASGSRGSYLGIAAVLATFVYLRVGKRVALAGVILAAAAYVGYLYMPHSVLGNVDTIVNYESDYNMTAPDGRIQVWERGLTMIEQHPLTGVGIDNFPIAEGMMHRYVQGQPWMQPHNSYLQAAAELGIFGFFAFIALLKRIGATARELRTDARSDEEKHLGLSLWLALVGFLVTGFFLHAAYATIFYVMVALTIASGRIHRRAIQEAA